jgi:hypothetical protein
MTLAHTSAETAPDLAHTQHEHRYVPPSQRERINIRIAANQAHQLHALSNEWNVTLVEALRRVLDVGLSGIMHHSD